MLGESSLIMFSFDSADYPHESVCVVLVHDCFSYGVYILTIAIVHRWIIKHILERNRRSAWRSQGFCPQCNYDLRAKPDRCPERGQAIEKVFTRLR
jgi:hypothetical protein